MLHLHDWQVTYCQPEGRPLLTFDAGFGQIELMPVRPLITGTHSATGALFGVNYRTAEVSIYNAITQQWLTESWSPSAWQIVPCTEEIQPVLAIASRWPWLPTHEPHGENTWIERPSALLSYS
ncbi:hypothetical protein [Leptolyngbya iicbica]|uniref:Uncharacterized protein n=2 Tax=Cyanophyceae TaxID=3028117 RepID=A0A4Q7EHX6_9CYAN|nr:hypothetical protein [Leptolyngbya sp. LK]RZM82727.1 hypothetical protein DYY88_05765 [Leptolyngbya sp. LK]